MSYQNIKIQIKLFDSFNVMYQFLERFETELCNIDNNDFRTFHYFLENIDSENYLEIRIDHNNNDKINSWIKEYFGDKIEKIKFEEYKPEIVNYGDGWWIAEKLFEYCARASICIINNKAKNKFRETKFVHCFLNQLGYDSLAEASFHNFTAGQMLIKYYRELEKK